MTASRAFTFTLLFGLMSSFFEGPFLDNTAAIQKGRLQNAVSEPIFERYRALGVKSREANDKHLAQIEKEAITFLQTDPELKA